MAKVKTRYVCSNCGGVSTSWLGRCPQCGEWNTMVEEDVVPEPPKGAAALKRTGLPLNRRPFRLLLWKR